MYNSVKYSDKLKLIAFLFLNLDKIYDIMK